MTSLRSALAALALICTPVLPASSHPQQVQDAGSAEGMVVERSTGGPLARVKVVIRRAEGGAGTLAVTTDSSGKFIFQNVPAGQYRILVTRDGYVPAEYGQRPDRPGILITLGSRQERKPIVIGMMSTGAIAGRVRDRYGDPVANAYVQASRYSYPDGRRVLTPIQSGRTNDRGEYRLYWLQPGQYLVSAIPSADALSDGSIPADSGDPGASWSPMAASGSQGEYISVYFPGTTDPAAATAIDVHPGAEFTGVDLTAAETHTVRISGRVIGGISGAVQRRTLVKLVSRTKPGGAAAERSTPSSANGTFEFRGVVPDTYELVAISNESSPSSNGGRAARLPIEVGGADIENIALALQPGASISGRITLEAGFVNKTPSLTSVRVQLVPEPSISQLAPPAATISPNGTFKVPGAFPGNYRLRITGLPGNAYAKMAVIGGLDALNSGLRIDGEPRGQLEILISANSGSLDAAVFDSRQAPAAGATVALIPDAALRHRPDLYHTASADDAGRVHIEGLMPGDYKAFAWDNVQDGAWLDANFIRAHEGRATPVRIREGGNGNLSLISIPSKY